ncbi:MAG: thioredoxin domain-containing protein [Acidobacteriota bacterium]|nr:thioredoxin domain-containing protein [Acidobacteriota bacterium]
MRTLLFLLPALALLGQTTHKTAMKTAMPAAANFKAMGSASAPLTLEVYADYECPHCMRFYQDVVPEVISEFVKTGKVRLLHRDFPLQGHAYARIAAKYANAAGQLGAYDLVVGQIFKTQADWSQNGNVDGEVAKVVPPGTMQKIRELVKNDAHLDDTVNTDMAQGTADGLNQTPTLVIVNNATHKRQRIDGPVPFVILKTYLDQLLAKG